MCLLSSTQPILLESRKSTLPLRRLPSWEPFQQISRQSALAAKLVDQHHAPTSTIKPRKSKPRLPSQRNSPAWLATCHQLRCSAVTPETSSRHKVIPLENRSWMLFGCTSAPLACCDVQWLYDTWSSRNHDGATLEKWLGINGIGENGKEMGCFWFMKGLIPSRLHFLLTLFRVSDTAHILQFDLYILLGYRNLEIFWI